MAFPSSGLGIFGTHIIVEDGRWERMHVPRNNPECEFKWTPWQSHRFIPRPDFAVDINPYSGIAIMNTRTCHLLKSRFKEITP